MGEQRVDTGTDASNALTLHLLGRPRAERPGTEVYQFRSRKSWAVLAYLVLAERPPARSRLASLLFADADDPLRALRWSLVEIRRCLGDEGAVSGDPVILQLPSDAVVDVHVVAHGAWPDAVDVPGLDEELLDGPAPRGASAFESWLLSQRQRLAAAAEAILHEAALGSMSQGALLAARDYALRAAAMSPLDENHQALLIRLYRLAGDDVGAAEQFAKFSAMLDSELGVPPGLAVQAAMRERSQSPETAADAASIEAIIESASAAVSAGAGETGVQALRTAVRLADGAEDAGLRIHSRLVLAEALIHAIGGLDEDGLASLSEADRIAQSHDDFDAMARARAEIGYVDFLRGRYDRAERWLTDALARGQDEVSLTAKATTYLGAVESDRAVYPRAVSLLEEAVTLSRRTGDLRREAFGLSMLGRINLLRDDLDSAARQLDASVTLAQRDHWLWFLPWPQALRGEVHLASNAPDVAAEVLTQAFARACQFGDPCWEGMSARGLAMVAEEAGETDRAFELLSDAHTRCNRLTDPYVWLEVHILDAQCELGRRHGHPQTAHWVDAMRSQASRTGMRELTVRSMLHAAALGSEGDAASAVLLGATIENPVLGQLLRRLSSASA